MLHGTMFSMDRTFFDNLQSIVGIGNAMADEPMSAHTTFKIGGPAEYFVVPSDVAQVREVVGLCRKCDVPWRILGHGSNLLVADSGVRGVVIQILSNMSEIELHPNGIIVAQAGASNAKVAAVACREGLAGYEFAAGIPGTIGGAAIMNAGAYSGEFRDVAFSVECMTQEGEIVEIAAADAGWGYRSSMMGSAGMVVLSARLKLKPDDPLAIRERMDDLANRRSSKQPLDVPSAGSTFKRPEGFFAAKLIDDAGLRGFRCGGAQVSEKHTGFVVNTGDATAQDVLDVIHGVQRAVLKNAGVSLEPEVRMWGFGEDSYSICD